MGLSPSQHCSGRESRLQVRYRITVHRIIAVRPYTIVSAKASPDLPEDCEARIVHFEPTKAERVLQDMLAALGRDDSPEMENVGRLFSDEVQLTCG